MLKKEKRIGTAFRLPASMLEKLALAKIALGADKTAIIEALVDRYLPKLIEEEKPEQEEALKKLKEMLGMEDEKAELRLIATDSKEAEYVVHSTISLDYSITATNGEDEAEIADIARESCIRALQDGSLSKEEYNIEVTVEPYDPDKHDSINHK